MRLYQCYLTNNECYQADVKIKPVGVMVHSTGANNPKLSRYVAPDDGRIGRPSANNWNQFRPGGRQVCVHAFIGKLEDGSIATYQTLPWDTRGWHSGYYDNRSKTNANKMGYIGFEICEDGLNDAQYFRAVYQEAVELTAYLCKLYGLDPMKDGVVICHKEGNERKIASGHKDVTHWFPLFGKTMNDFRADVKKAIGKAPDKIPEKDPEVKYVKIEVPILKKGSKGDAVRTVQVLLNKAGYDTKGIDGSWGPGMDTAFKKWQKDNGMASDGSCGPASWSKLLCG